MFTQELSFTNDVEAFQFICLAQSIETKGKLSLKQIQMIPMVEFSSWESCSISSELMGLLVNDVVTKAKSTLIIHKQFISHN